MLQWRSWICNCCSTRPARQGHIPSTPPTISLRTVSSVTLLRRSSRTLSQLVRRDHMNPLNHVNHSPTSLSRFAIAAIAAFALVTLATAASAQQFTIGPYHLQQSTRVSLTQYDYTYTADLTDTGSATTNVVGTVTSNSPNTIVTKGTVTLALSLPAPPSPASIPSPSGRTEPSPLTQPTSFGPSPLRKSPRQLRGTARPCMTALP